MLTIVFAVLPIWETEILRKSVPIIHVLSNIKLRILVFSASLGICIIGILGNMFFKKKYYYWITYFFGIFHAQLLVPGVAEKF